MVKYGGGDLDKGFKGSPIVLMIAYLDHLNINGKGLMWDKNKPRIGAWQQNFIDKAIAADKRPDGTFGAAMVVHGVVYGDNYPIGRSYKIPNCLRTPSSGSKASGSDSDNDLLIEKKVERIRKIPAKKRKDKAVMRRGRSKADGSRGSDEDSDSLDRKKAKIAKTGAGSKCPEETFSRKRSCRTRDTPEMMS